MTNVYGLVSVDFTAQGVRATDADRLDGDWRGNPVIIGTILPVVRTYGTPRWLNTYIDPRVVEMQAVLAPKGTLIVKFPGDFIGSKDFLMNTRFDFYFRSTTIDMSTNVAVENLEALSDGAKFYDSVEGTELVRHFF